jgi:hypothetical protein
MPLQSMKALSLNPIEAVTMWVTGSPPKRFQHSGDENITDVMEDCKLAKQAMEHQKDVGNRGDV